jgi:hypothetical protein
MLIWRPLNEFIGYWPKSITLIIMALEIVINSILLHRQKLETLSNVSSSKDFENDQQIRHAILLILYTDRRQNPSDSGVGSWRLEKLLEWPEKILEFHIWYLKEKCWIQRVDTGGYAITAIGVEVVEEDGFILEKERLLTYQGGSSNN